MSPRIYIISCCCYFSVRILLYKINLKLKFVICYLNSCGCANWMQSLVSLKTNANRNLSQKSPIIILDRDGVFSFFLVFDENLTSSSTSSPAFSSAFSLSTGSTAGELEVPLYQTKATCLIHSTTYQ